MLAELFLTTEMWPQLGWSKATLLQPTRVQTKALNHRGGGTVPTRSRRKHGEETCCHFAPSPQHSTGVNTLNLVANALQSLWYFRGWDCIIAGEDAVCSIRAGCSHQFSSSQIPVLAQRKAGNGMGHGQGSALCQQRCLAGSELLLIAAIVFSSQEYSAHPKNLSSLSELGWQHCGLSPSSSCSPPAITARCGPHSAVRDHTIVAQ